MLEPEDDPLACLSRYFAGYYPYFDRKIDKFYWDRELTRSIIPIDATVRSRAAVRLARCKQYEIVWDRDFDAVMALLTDQGLRKETWVHGDVVRVYRALSSARLLHTVEAYEGEQLVGALLGVALPGVFAGETMIHTASDASKACLYGLVERCADLGIEAIDVQVSHPRESPCGRLGEVSMPLADYLNLLGKHRRAFGADPATWLSKAAATGLDFARSGSFPESRQAWASAEATVACEAGATTLAINGFQVMSSWELPLMRRMGAVCRAGDVVLEVGYGLGIAAAEIQHCRPARHVIVECNRSVARAAHERWQSEHEAGRVMVVNEFWEDAIEELSQAGPFDAILFDTFPLQPIQQRGNHLSFFPHAADLLKRGGRFTYFSDESSVIGVQHHAALRAAFPNARLIAEPISVDPPAHCDYWSARQILHVEIQTPPFE